MMPFVSVIVPVYNVEKHIQRCIESLLKQTYKNFEILLVNDGSTDNSGNICDEYKARNKQIRVFHIKNSGVSNARNFGIENAAGEYLQFVDSDDFVEETYIENMVKKSRENNSDLVICGIKQVSFNGNNVKKIISKSEGWFSKKSLHLIMSDLINSSYINYCYSKLISRKLIMDKNIRFNKQISLGEDTLFVLELLKNCNNLYISTHADYNYLIHSGDTLTFKYRQDKFYLLNNLSLKLKQFCIDEGLYTDQVMKALDRRYLEIIKFCLEENFKPNININLTKRIKNINNILKDQDVFGFFSGDNCIFGHYPKSLIYALRSQSALVYIYVYYSLIIANKIRTREKV